MYWVVLAIRLALWGAVGLGGVYVWRRGLEGSLEDFGWVVGFLGGLGEEVGGGGRAGRSAGKREWEATRVPRQGRRGAGRGRTRGAGWG